MKVFQFGDIFIFKGILTILDNFILLHQIELPKEIIILNLVCLPHSENEVNNKLTNKVFKLLNLTTIYI